MCVCVRREHVFIIIFLCQFMPMILYNIEMGFNSLFDAT